MNNQQALNRAALNGYILLVDDNKINQAVATNMLQILGCQVDVVNNGEKAITAFRSRPYDLVLMDCYMPIMNGFIASEKIRAFEQRHNHEATPIIAITADQQDSIEAQCQLAGMNDYLSKPFTKESIEAMLTRWLPSKNKEPHDTHNIIDYDPVPLADLQKINQQLVITIIQIFIKNTPNTLTQMHQMLETNDWDNLYRQAHTLKANAAQLGFIHLSHHAKNLEVLAKAFNTRESQQTLSMIEQLASSAMQRLQKEYVHT